MAESLPNKNRKREKRMSNFCITTGHIKDILLRNITKIGDLQSTLGAQIKLLTHAFDEPYEPNVDWSDNMEYIAEKLRLNLKKFDALVRNVEEFIEANTAVLAAEEKMAELYAKMEEI